MKKNNLAAIDAFFAKYSVVAYLKTNFITAVNSIVSRVNKDGKILICGNGGSASDCDHIAGELLKEFYIKRKIDPDVKAKLIKNSPEGQYIADKLQGSIPAISLMAQCGFISAFSNDAASDLAVSQQVYGYGSKNDILIALSTSGNAKNINYAICTAKAKGLYTIGFTGKSGGSMKDKCDILFNVPETETYLVQELHLPLYHMLCRAVEYEIFGE